MRLPDLTSIASHQQSFSREHPLDHLVTMIAEFSDGHLRHARSRTGGETGRWTEEGPPRCGGGPPVNVLRVEPAPQEAAGVSVSAGVSAAPLLTAIRAGAAAAVFWMETVRSPFSRLASTCSAVVPRGRRKERCRLC